MYRKTISLSVTVVNRSTTTEPIVKKFLTYRMKDGCYQLNDEIAKHLEFLNKTSLEAALRSHFISDNLSKLDTDILFTAVAAWYLRLIAADHRPHWATGFDASYKWLSSQIKNPQIGRELLGSAKKFVIRGYNVDDNALEKDEKYQDHLNHTSDVESAKTIVIDNSDKFFRTKVDKVAETILPRSTSIGIKILDQLSQDFTQLLENEYLYDVVIEVGEQPNTKRFKVHSVILYQRSLYFRQKLTNATKKNNIIEIKMPNHSVKVFDIIIRYIYSGIVSLENPEASVVFDLLITVNEFKFTELVERIQPYLIDNNASWIRLNFSRVYQISFQNENLKALQQFCNDILVKHPSVIFNSDEFDTLQENALIALLKNNDLQMEESEIWDKVIQWGKARTPDLPSNLEELTHENFNSLKTTLQHCLPHIRYFQIPSKDILKKIQPYQNILEKNIWVDILAKYLDPDMPITSPVLPPRKKATSQLPSRKASKDQFL
ncbi:hypothetical protein C2G38_695502 [Gigaspora rosea]|uniref:BTB domain-containing protein n=1 Tax=Gigaspora rosea TaxID=44941 RepID=A0A397UAE3_9GLOM|nr:hypothetical protein C2G38_695502 [Gigaspora rosea]